MNMMAIWPVPDVVRYYHVPEQMLGIDHAGPPLRRSQSSFSL